MYIYMYVCSYISPEYLTILFIFFIFIFYIYRLSTILFIFFRRCETALKNNFKKAKSLVLKWLFTNYLSFKGFHYHGTIIIIF